MGVLVRNVLIGIVALAFIGLAIVFFLSAHAKDGLFAASSNSSLNIGVLAPLTGNYSIVGGNVRDGMELAKENLLAKNSNQRINLVFEDSCVAKDTISGFNKMTTVDNIDLLGASFCIIGFVPVIPMAEEKKIISFSVAASPDSVLNKKYVFSLNKSIKSDANDLAAYAVNKLGAKTAAIVFYNTALGSDYNKYLSESFTNLGADVLSTHLTEIDRTDYRTELTLIKSENPDVIIAIELSQYLGLLLKQSRELGVSSKFLSQSTAEDPTVLSAAQGAAEGMIISTSEPKTITPEIEAFKSAYAAKYNKNANIMSAIAYDSLMLEVAALNKCNKEVECLRNEFSSIKNYSGASGLITMGADGSTYREPNFKIVKNGEFVQIE
jgi:branched-chain amino acid transport system substrate-binding protein